MALERYVAIDSYTHAKLDDIPLQFKFSIVAGPSVSSSSSMAAARFKRSFLAYIAHIARIRQSTQALLLSSAKPSIEPVQVAMFEDENRQGHLHSFVWNVDGRST